MTFSTLINAATLKGYLMAKDAPAEMIAMAQGIVDAQAAVLAKPVERVANEDVRLSGPDPETMLTLTIPPNLRPIDEPETLPAKPPAVFPPETPLEESEDASPASDVIAAPETALAEENSIPSAGWGAEDGLLSIADKHKRYREKLRREGRCPRCGVECAPYAECEAHRKYKLEKRGFDEYKRPPEHGQRAPRRESILKPEMLVEIQAHLADESFDVVGQRYGVSGETIRNFLKRHDIDPARYRKSSSGLPAVQVSIPEHLPTPRSGYLWKPEEKQTLMGMKAAGKPWEEIESALGKTTSQCKSMYHLERNKRKKTAATDAEGWPLSAKPEQSSRQELTINSPAQPKMKFKTVTVKKGYGRPEYQMQVPEAIGTEKDPETGATVTKYPAMHAHGSYPQRNVSVKGGA